MAIRLAPTPAILYRIGRAPDPLVFPPLAFCGTGRYDDPLGRQSVLYAAMDRRAAFLESLDSFRPDSIALADRNSALGIVSQPPDKPERASIPLRFFRRLIARLSMGANQHWLDVRAPETHAVLRDELGHRFTELGLGSRFVLGDLLSNDHRITQIVAGWAIDEGFHGIAYASCHDPALTCWAIFDHAEIGRVGAARPLDLNDPDLLAVASLWNLDIPRP